jgi:hypothetical protein
MKKHVRPVVERYLEDEPKARERSGKDRGMVNLLMKMRPKLGDLILNCTFTKEEMVDILQTYSSMDRMWRKILEERPDLRGSDYGKKEELEQDAQIEIGYEAGYNQDVKKLGRLE